jgi:hypothetical protein
MRQSIPVVLKGDEKAQEETKRHVSESKGEKPTMGMYEGEERHVGVLKGEKAAKGMYSGEERHCYVPYSRASRSGVELVQCNRIDS